jgi:hypothetical protein
LHHTGRDELSEETVQTPGMRRDEAISTYYGVPGSTISADDLAAALAARARRARGSRLEPGQ